MMSHPSFHTARQNLKFSVSSMLEAVILNRAHTLSWGLLYNTQPSFLWFSNFWLFHWEVSYTPSKTSYFVELMKTFLHYFQAIIFSFACFWLRLIFSWPIFPFFSEAVLGTKYITINTFFQLVHHIIHNFMSFHLC